MKHFILIFSIFWLDVLFPNQTLAGDRVVIGVSTALTGNGAPSGDDIRRTLLFANKELTGGKYRFIFEDDVCSGKNAASVAQKLVNVDKVRYVLGHVCSSAVLGSAPIYEKAKVIVISPSASAETISRAGDYIFRTWMSDAKASKRLFDHMESKHRNVGVLSEITDYAQSFFEGFQASNTKTEVAIINENFATDSNDYRPLITKLRNQNIDSLFINSQSEATFLSVLKQVRDLKIHVPIYGAYWPASAEFLRTAGGLSEGIIFVDMPSGDQILDQRGKSLLQKFKAEYGNLKFSDMIFATTFEAFRALHMAIESGKDPKEYLYSTTFPGIFGNWSFDSNGDIRGPEFSIKALQATKVVTLE